jgi:hypothetical protein
LDLEIALGGVPAKVQPHYPFQPGRRCVETSDDVIEEAFTIIAAIWRALFHALCNPLGVRAGSNRRFQFQKRSQFLINVHNETLSVVPMCACNPDRSPVAINA